jgi:hypothetical protein
MNCPGRCDRKNNATFDDGKYIRKVRRIVRFPSFLAGYRIHAHIEHTEYNPIPPYSHHPEFPSPRKGDIGLNGLSDHLLSQIVFPGSSTPVGRQEPKGSPLYQQLAMQCNGAQHTPPAPFGLEGRLEPVCLF